jgi:hypothetical protein
MSCCGKKRNGVTESYSFNNSSVIQGSATKMWADSLFMYTGETGLTIKGNITGHKYRFRFKGDQQLIDYRDAGAMMAVPVLEKLTAK